MPTTRKRTKRGIDRRIGPRAVAAFVAGDVAALDRELGRIPFSDPSPIEATTDEPPEWANGRHCWRTGWADARQLRAQLEEAARHADNTN